MWRIKDDLSYDDAFPYRNLVSLKKQVFGKVVFNHAIVLLLNLVELQVTQKNIPVGLVGVGLLPKI